MNSYIKTVPVAYSIYKDGDNPVFGNSVTKVEIEDDAAGPYITISQCNDDHEGSIKLEFDEAANLCSLIMQLRQEWDK